MSRLDVPIECKCGYVSVDFIRSCVASVGINSLIRHAYGSILILTDSFGKLGRGGSVI